MAAAAASAASTKAHEDAFFAKFIVKNLDTGETFHVDQIETFLEKSSLLTFAGESRSGWTVSIPEVKQFGVDDDDGDDDDDDDDDGNGGGGAGGATRRRRRRGSSSGSSGMKAFTAYRIYVTNPAITKDRRTFSVYRRYSEFCKLDRQLREQGWGDRIKLDLPNKRWFNNMSETVVKQRQQALQAYLNALLHYCSPADCQPLNDFFSAAPTARDLVSPSMSPLVEPRFLTLAQATVEFGLLPPPQHEKAVLESMSASLSART